MLAVLLALVIEPFTLVQATQRGAYFVPDDKRHLKVDVGRCETFLEGAEARIGVRVPPFRYYRVETQQEVAQYADFGYAAGVARSGDTPRTWSIMPCHKHEIAHFVGYQLTTPARDRSDLFWHEGFAGWLAGDYGWFSRWNFRQYLIHTLKRKRDVPWAIRRFASLTSPPESMSGYTTEYRIAEAFTHYLIREFGEEKYYGFLRRVEQERKAEEGGHAERAFEAVYGISVAAASERWLD